MTFKIKCGYEKLTLLQDEIELVFKTTQSEILLPISDKSTPEMISNQLDHSIEQLI